MRAMVAWLSKLEPKWVIQNSAILAILCFVMYFMANSMILPMQNAHLKLVERAIETSGKIVETQTKIAEIQSQQSPKIDRIDRNTSQQVMAASGRER